MVREERFEDRSEKEEGGCEQRDPKEQIHGEKSIDEREEERVGGERKRKRENGGEEEELLSFPLATFLERAEIGQENILLHWSAAETATD